MAFDYPNSPTVGQLFQGLVWDGEKWVSALNPTGSGAVRYDMPQGLGANQMAQGRANIAVTKKNYIINGAMMISQENGLTGGATNVYYAADQFYTSFSHQGTPTFRQLAIATPGGSPNRIQYVASVADATVDAGNIASIEHKIEGLRTADLKFGTANAKTFTLQFGVKAPAGTYCVAFRSANSRSYVAEYVITAADVTAGDVVKSVTIPGDITGTWAVDNTIGLIITWTLMCGTTYQTTPNVWAAGDKLGTANQFNLMGGTNNTFDLFDVSLTEGNVAPPFQVPDYASELALCQRYYWKWTGTQFVRLAIGWVDSATTVQTTLSMPAIMRAIPTIQMSNLTCQGIAITSVGNINMSANIAWVSFNTSGQVVNNGAQIYVGSGSGTVVLLARL